MKVIVALMKLQALWNEDGGYGKFVTIPAMRNSMPSRRVRAAPCQCRDRLDSMMRYGQTTLCRVRFLTRYFASEIGKNCKHCDNCQDGQTENMIDTEPITSEL